MSITSQCQSRAENCFKVTTRVSFHVTTDIEGVRIICSMYDWPDWTSKDFLLGGVNHWTAMNLNTKVFKTITSQCQSRAENCFKVTTRVSFHVTTDLEGVRIICSMYDWPDWTSKDFLMGGVNHWTAMNLNTKVFKKPLLTFTLCGEALGGSKMLFYAGCGFGGLLVVVLLWITVALNVAPSEEDDAPAPKKAANVTQNPMETASHARKTPMTKSLAGSPHGGASKTTSRGSFSDHGSTGTEVVNLESAE
ncbi:hypothetical protein EGW08_022151 [Elysia chlorotica]|uniref:Uncharacterized protein n=1 Tax=Elysia chlorotica TaxID=188477 RepID=A0A3S0Z3U8_ELYCH|nr:hypothetical protein EGW08_022151 [Elysia chlorotica]